MSIRRPPATAPQGCASCSATSWAIPTPASNWRSRYANGDGDVLSRECREAAICNLMCARRQPRSITVAKRESACDINSRERTSPLPLLRHSAEDDVPEGGGDAVAEAVVLEVVAHVMLALALATVRLGHEVVHVVVRVVVEEVAGDEAAEERVRGGRAEDQGEGEEEERRQRDRDGRRHHQPQLVVGVVVVDAVDDEVHAPPEGVVGLPVEDQPVQPVLRQCPDPDPAEAEQEQLPGGLALV